MLLAGVELKDGALESAWVMGGEVAGLEKKGESGGELISVPKLELLFDRSEFRGKYVDCCVLNLGCECERRRVLEAK